MASAIGMESEYFLKILGNEFPRRAQYRRHRENSVLPSCRRETHTAGPKTDEDKDCLLSFLP